MKTKTIRLKRWKVEVLQDRLNRVHHCRVIAVDPMDARIMAYILDSGLSPEYEFDEDFIWRIEHYTKILEESSA